jgi:hypothetical protein
MLSSSRSSTTNLGTDRAMRCSSNADGAQRRELVEPAGLLDHAVEHGHEVVLPDPLTPQGFDDLSEFFLHGINYGVSKPPKAS